MTAVSVAAPAPGRRWFRAGSVTAGHGQQIDPGRPGMGRSLQEFPGGGCAVREMSSRRNLHATTNRAKCQ